MMPNDDEVSYNKFASIVDNISLLNCIDVEETNSLSNYANFIREHRSDVT